MAKKIDVNGLGHYHDKVSAMLASEYSSSKTYAVGDYCFHAGTLYECTTAITTAENWTSGHWTAAKLAEDTSALKTALNEQEDTLDVIHETIKSENLYFSEEVSNGFLQSNGTLSIEGSFANYRTSDYIPIKGNTNYRYMVFSPTTFAVSIGRKAALIFDSSKNIISGTYQNVNHETSLLINHNSAAYVRFSFYYDALSMLTEGSTEKETYIPYIEPYDVIKCKLGSVPMEQIAKEGNGGNLTGKKWVACGDSFTDYTNKNYTSGKFVGKSISYPRIISERCQMNLVETFMNNGRTLAYPAVPDGFVNSLTCPNQDWYYQNIPADADYITIMLGINDSHYAPNSSGGDGEDNTGEIPIGSITDNTTTTYYGAWNVVLSWLIENRPFAHIGILVSNGVNSVDYRTAQIEIAKKYGVAYIDLNGDEHTPVMIRSQNPNIASSVKTIVNRKQAVDYDGTTTGSVNLHPNWQAHEYESTFIENFLRSI